MCRFNHTPRVNIVMYISSDDRSGRFRGRKLAKKHNLHLKIKEISKNYGSVLGGRDT